MLNLITIPNKYLSPVWKENPFWKGKRTTTKLKYIEMRVSQIESEPVGSPMGLPGFESEGILPNPCSLFKTLSRSSSQFPCWFPQLAHCVTALSPSFSSPSPGTETFLAEGAALFAGKSGVRAFTRRDFLLNTKLHFQQYITAIVQVGLQRIFWGQHPSPHKARPSVSTWLIMREPDSWLWGLLDNAFLLLGTASAQW